MRCAALLIWILPVFLAGCAKTGEPHPPVVLIPKPATDLVGRQYSDQILLSMSLPAANTNGSPVTTLGEIQVLRRIDADRTASAPLSEAAFLKGATPILTITPDSIADYLNDKTLSFRDELSLPDRAVIYSGAFRYAVRVMNKKRQAAGLSNQFYIAPVPVPPPVKGLNATLSQEAVRLTWTEPSENLDGSRPSRVAGYNIFRTEDPKRFPPAPLNPEPLPKPEYEDGTFKFDKTYYYTVAVVANRENPFAESLSAPAVAVNARDNFPPGMPANLNGVATAGTVLLLWAAPPESDIAGYRIYRKDESEYRRLNQELTKVLSYRDEDAPAGKIYYYRVAAVDTHGNEGAAAETVVDSR